MAVTLREVTRDTLGAVLKLQVAAHQGGFVATNARSIAQAHFWPGVAWFRAIYADELPIGFVMLAFEDGEPPYVWRFMIDAAHQGRGLGRGAMAALLEAIRARCPDATQVRLSHVPGEGDPGPFYEKVGFAYTGEVHEGERVMSLVL